MISLVAFSMLLALVTPFTVPAVAATVHVAEAVSASPPGRSARININTADVQQLMTLSGVSRTLAEKIVKHRETNGLFKKPADLQKVDGVGGELWKKNRARIVVK